MILLVVVRGMNGLPGIPSRQTGMVGVGLRLSSVGFGVVAELLAGITGFPLGMVIVVRLMVRC